MTTATTRSGPRVRARWIVLLVVGLLILAAYIHFGDGPSPIFDYRVVDGHTLVVRAQTGPQVWTRVTNLAETPTTVSVTIASLGLPFVASTGTSMTEVTVHLDQPLGDRQVIDGSEGRRVLPSVG